MRVRARVAKRFPPGLSALAVLRTLRWEETELQHCNNLSRTLRKAKAFYHPDAAARRSITPEQLCECVEICKVLNSLSC